MQDLSKLFVSSANSQDGYNDPEFPEMVEWFEKRTSYHIESVRRYISIANSVLEDIDHSKMEQKAIDHDRDKFEQPLFIPYVYLTWYYHCIYGDGPKEFKLSDEMQKSCNDMSFKHTKQNSHHPESFDASLEQNQDLIGTDRDKKSLGNKPVDASLMDKESMVEFCCDLCAVGEERGNSPMSFFNKMNGKKWKFNKEQTKFIKMVFKEIWKRGR
jgi:hypothetical protein